MNNEKITIDKKIKNSNDDTILDILNDVLFGKILPFLFFGFFTIAHSINLLKLYRTYSKNLTPLVEMKLFHYSITIVFFFMMTYLYIVRSKPKDRTESLYQKIIAFLGSFIIMLSPLVKNPETDSMNVMIISFIFILIGGILTLYSLSHLKRNFSIIPEARSLVKTGPYKFIRHPMYLSEILWVFGSVLPIFSKGILVLYSLMVIFLFMRANFEEEILSKNFEEYEELKKSNWQIIPFFGKK